MLSPTVELFPADTSPEAHRVQMEILRRMGPKKRSEQVIQLNHVLRLTSEAGVRRRHPEHTDEQVRLAAIRIRLGDVLFRQAYPGVEVDW